MVREAQSDESVDHISPLSDFWKNLNERAIPVGSIMIKKDLYSFLCQGVWLSWEWKPCDKIITVCHQHEYTGYVALMLWVFSLGKSPCRAPWWVGSIAIKTHKFSLTQAKTRDLTSSRTTLTKKKYSMNLHSQNL